MSEPQAEALAVPDDTASGGPAPILVLTATGRTLDLHRVGADPAVFSGEALALQLSKICRFNGALPTRDGFYSVAEHSVHCAELARLLGLGLPVQRACLLHDAHEMVIGDIIEPVRRYLGVAEDAVASRLALKLLEHAIDRAVGRRWDVDLAVHAGTVGWIDKAMLAIERHHLLVPHASWDVDTMLAQLPDVYPRPQCWAPAEAHDRFLESAVRLFSGAGCGEQPEPAGPGQPEALL